MGTLRDVVRDEAVRHEIETLTGAGIPLPGSERLGVGTDEIANAVIRDPELDGRRPRPSPKAEAVIRDFGRPVLYVRDGRISMPASGELRTRLRPVKARLEAGIPSVGRIEFSNNPVRSWGGTGWVIDDGVIVTNRHVAELFVERGARSFLAKRNPVTNEVISARIDFREEYGRPETDADEIAVRKVLFVEREARRRPDVAFLLLTRAADLPGPIPVLDHNLGEGADIAVVGYPAEDPDGVPSAEAALRIFGGHYGVKRVSPGKVLVSQAKDVFFSHDATTLGGNSGSAVLDLETGAAAGLHFLGDLGNANFAVKPTVLRNELAKARSGRPPKAKVPRPVRRPDRPGLAESTPEEYADRKGFDTAFLGSGRSVPLPVKRTNGRDVLTFTDGDGKKQDVLHYTHFSVAMSVSRKLCLWSAVNIDGAHPQKAGPRTTWLIDPRIPREAQTLPNDDPDLDVYGDSPRFARGHMTRREDPVWGDEATAHLGNVDSMHYTNAIPQQQAFNAPIWLKLEDYALKNAKKDRMRISVITGPFFSRTDKRYYGVQVPVEFWKIIAFIHDETGKLSATGYSMSQEQQITDAGHLEFTFGPLENTSQHRIKAIEARTGLSFGTLSSHDGMGAEEGVRPQTLSSLDQIKFV